MSKDIIHELPEEVLAEANRVKGYFPYRIIWAYRKDDKWEVQASVDKRAMNKCARAGLLTVKFN